MPHHICMIKPYLLLIIVSLFIVSCSTYQLKNSCEATNWFEYAQSLAQQGKYPNDDNFIQQCRGVEKISDRQVDLGFKAGREKLCTYDQIRQKGQDGESVSYQFCGSLEEKKMKASYRQGLELFCTEESGLQFGRAGNIYNQVCPKDIEKPFLQAYQKSRKDYLQAKIKILDEEMYDREKSLRSLENTEQIQALTYSRLPPAELCSQKRVFEEKTKKEVERRVCEEAPYIKAQRESQFARLEQLRKQLDQERAAIHNLRAEKKNLQQELIKLP